MEVHPITYIYLIFGLVFLIEGVIELFRGNIEKGLTWMICLFMCAIGFSCNYQICPLFYCLGVE